MSITESTLQNCVDQKRPSCANQKIFVEVSGDLDNIIPFVSLNLNSHDGLPDANDCLFVKHLALQTDFK